MKKFHKKIVESGFIQINNGTTHYNKRVKLLNYYALIWIYLAVFFLVTDIISGIFQQRSAIGHAIKTYTIVALIIVVFLNKKFYYSLAKLLFIITAFIAMNASSLLISPGIFTEYYLFLIPGFALSLYDKKSIILTCLVVAIVSFFLPYHILSIYTTDITNRIIYPSILGLFVALYFLINYFKKLNNQNEHLLALERDKVLSDKIILEQQEKKLRELDEFKSHFFINLSHEIRTPLTLIKGYYSQLNKKNLIEEDIAKLKVIEEQTLAMQSIIDDIMNLSKLDTKTLKLNLEPVNISDLLTKIHTNFKPLFNEKEISFVIKSYIKNVFILLDYSLFEKAISNLISNSLKFTPKGKEVNIIIDQDSHGVWVNIEDTGIGIPKEETSKLFDRFYQVKNDITKSQGNGIGLAFVKSILNHHNFTIKVNSDLGAGSKFSIKIPQSSIKNNIETNTTIQTNLEKIQRIKKVCYSPQKVKSERNKVLVVDDHVQMRSYIKSILSEYEIKEAENGKEALELIKLNSFNAIVTDYMMPIMDGESFVRKIKKQGLEIPIIVLTARMDIEGKLKMLRLGVDSYLFKPFLEEELKIQVANGIKLFDNLRNFKATLPKKETLILNKQALKFNENLKTFIYEKIKSENLKVDDVASHFNISARTLNRKTRALLGQSVQELILETRLIRVKELLEEDPDYTKSEITRLVGLKNTSYFFEKYQERFGIVV